MKLTFPFSAVFVMAIAIGCASFSTNVFRTEQTAVNVVYGAYVPYTQALLSGTLHITPDQSNAVKTARLKFSASVGVLESFRISYDTNSELKPQVEASLAAVLENSSNVVYLIHLFQ